VATVLAVYNSEGCVGRCDAHCHEAQHAECECICGGMNHGAGTQQAIQNTTEMVEEWVQEYGKKNNLELDLVEAMGLLSTPEAIRLPENGSKVVTDPRRLTGFQRGALLAAQGQTITNGYGKRTFNSLIKRGLMEKTPLGYQTTKTGEALLRTSRHHAN